jgi:hypothetical protein
MQVFFVDIDPPAQTTDLMYRMAQEIFLLYYFPTYRDRSQEMIRCFSHSSILTLAAVGFSSWH